MKLTSITALLLAFSLSACGGTAPEPEVPETPDVEAEAEDAADSEEAGDDEAEEAGDDEGEEAGDDEAEGDGDEAEKPKKTLEGMKGNRMEKADAEE